MHVLLTDEQPRDILRTTLIESHFAESAHARLAQQSTIHVEAFEYSRKLLRQARYKTVDEAEAPSDVSEPVRDQGFRQAVLEAYDHQCAISGIRILTTAHHTAVEAAHTKPWSVSQNDDPRNGLALSKLCHWAFQEGLLTITPEYTIPTPPELTAPYNTTGTLDKLDGRSPHLPEEATLWPDPACLDWHRDERFRD